MRQSVYNPADAEDLRIELVSAIMRRWSVPSVGFVNGEEDYKLSDKRSAFKVHAFDKTFIVSVEEVEHD